MPVNAYLPLMRPVRLFLFMANRNSNIERQKHADASKEAKARHNGVDTSKWGNDTPRIEVPEGWQDHQYTQQLVRKYFANSFVYYDFTKRLAILYLTEEEIQVLRSEERVNKHLFINQTCLGICLDVHIRKSFFDHSDLPEKGEMVVNGCSYDVKNFPFISSVSIQICTPDHKGVLLSEDLTVSRAAIEELASKESDFRFLSSVGIKYALEKNNLI